MNLLRSYVRRLLAEEPLGIHGAGMTEDELMSRLGFGGIDIEKSGQVTDDEADRIAKKIAEDEPERIYAYSRGAAAFNKAMLDDDMPSSVPPVTYVAPAALRGWTDAAVPDLPADSVTIIGDRDTAVPIKQACDVAKQAGTPLFVHPEKSHAGVLYTKGSTDGAYALDVDACLADDDLPDWGTGAHASSEELQAQTRRSGELAHEAVLRAFVRGLLLEKKWADFNAPKGKTIDIAPEDFEEPVGPPVRDLDDEIFDLIQNAYKDVSLPDGKFGNIKVQRPEDLPAGYTVMKGADIDDDPDPDYFRGGKMRGGRFKLGIVGHDGSQNAINKYLEETAEDLKAGAIAEMSGKIAHVMITRHDVPAVTSEKEVEAMIGKQIDWVGRHPEAKFADRYGPDYEGWYTRGIAGGPAHMKILLGGG
jgi:hypothetical protein